VDQKVVVGCTNLKHWKLVEKKKLRKHIYSDGISGPNIEKPGGQVCVGRKMEAQQE
jgi:hypothetical protein